MAEILFYSIRKGRCVQHSLVRFPVDRISHRPWIFYVNHNNKVILANDNTSLDPLLSPAISQCRTIYGIKVASIFLVYKLIRDKFKT